MRILPADFVARWSGRIVNVHPSLLPRHRGLGTHQAVIDAGEATSGCTVHLVTAELDDGPILGQVEVAVLPVTTPPPSPPACSSPSTSFIRACLPQFVARERDPDWIRRKVDELALALPETRPKTSHGSPGWRVGSESSGNSSPFYGPATTAKTASACWSNAAARTKWPT